MRGARAVDAIIAYEDRRYFRWFHRGIDFRSVLAVALRARRGGASTIAMQLGRQLLRAVPRTLNRKVFEAALAVHLTRRYGKRHVLDVWLSQVPFGTARIVGIERAAERYFQKSVGDLDELDGLLLAERVTVCTGTYYRARTHRLVEWAARKKIITDAHRAEASARFATMIREVPGDVRD